MLYEELKELRDECQKITFDEWVEFWSSQNCGAEYALKNWNSFRDGPMLFITYHTSGPYLLYYILSFIEAPRKSVTKGDGGE